MKLRLERTWCSKDCTIGQLLIDGVIECFTLEDVVRPEKVYGETAVPVGTYNVVVTPSKRFQRDLPLLEHVPGFEGIRIHPGNTAANTDGCILVGRQAGPAYLTESRAAFNDLFKKIKDSLDSGDTVTMEIT